VAAKKAAVKSGRNANGRDARREGISGLPRPPRCAAVSLSVKEGSGSSQGEAMSLAKRTINLSDLDIEVVKPRKAVTETLVLEITGEDADRKASRLAERMAEDPRDYPVKVTVPRRTTELRVSGLEDSVTLEEVVTAVAKDGGCCAEEVDVGVIRTAPRRLGSVWIRCPLTVARKINGSTGGRADALSIGKLRIGCTAARDSPLPTRGLQCYKCLELGHVRRDCKSTVDCSDLSYRSSMDGHRAGDYLARVLMCLVCTDLGLPASHHMGSPACKPLARRKRAMQEVKIVPGNGAAATVSKETETEPSPT
jgi:hypothetical protein